MTETAPLLTVQTDKAERTHADRGDQDGRRFPGQRRQRQNKGNGAEGGGKAGQAPERKAVNPLHDRTISPVMGQSGA